MKKSSAIQFAALTARIRKAGSEIQLFPAGLIRARDGRPEGLTGWQLDEAAAKALIERAAARQTPFVIDYEHQTLYAETSGQPAPAAGWFDQLEWREGDGLYAINVEWTARASALIEGDEYRYLSPVFGYDAKTGVVTELLMAAVTNNPAIDGISDVAAARSQHNPEAKVKPVNKEQLKLLGLPEDATEEQITAALKSQSQKQTAAEQEVAALRAEAGKSPDPAKYVPADAVAQMQTQIAALTAQVTGGEVDRLVEAGLEDGRLVKSLEPWARELGKNDIAALRTYLGSAQPIASLTSRQTDGKKLPAETEALTADEIAVCRATGISQAQFIEAKKAEETAQ